jgi:hypothetical protein
MERRTDKLISEPVQQDLWRRRDTYGLTAGSIVLVSCIILVIVTLWKWLAIISIVVSLIGAVVVLLHYVVLPASTHWHTVRLRHVMEREKHDDEREARRAKLAALHRPYMGGTVDADPISEAPAPGTPEREIADFLGSASQRAMPGLPKRNGATNGVSHDLSGFDMDDGSSVDISTEEARQVAELSMEGRDVSTISRQVFHVRGGPELTEANERVRAIQRELIANGLE